MTARVRFNPAGFAQMIAEDIAPKLVAALADGQREAQQRVNVDTGDLQSTISFRIDVRADGLDGYLEAGTNYAIWQELEPDDQSRWFPVQTTTGIVRKRTGGRAYLRPGALKALRSFTRS